MFCCGCENSLQNHLTWKWERQRGEQREEKRGKEDGETKNGTLRGRSWWCGIDVVTYAYMVSD